MKIKNIFLFIVLLLFAGVFIKSRIEVKEYAEKRNIDTKLKNQIKAENKVDFDRLIKINRDIVAWISIPDTNIEYPVLKTDDNNYYLNHDIYGEYSVYGAIFIDQRLYDTDIFENKNCIIYGHNMGHWTDVMFGQLLKYREEKFYRKHKQIIIYTKNDMFTYDVVSVREVDSQDNSCYKVDFPENDYVEWLENVVNESIIKCDETDYGAGSKVISLSTCTYNNNSKRMVVTALKEGDD